MKLKSGTVGWVLLTGYVVAWDYWAARNKTETLSSAFGRAARHPVHRWPVTLAWTVTTAHLFGVLPARIDPFLLVGALLVNEKSNSFSGNQLPVSGVLLGIRVNDG